MAESKKKREKKRRALCECGSDRLTIRVDELGNETGVVSCDACDRRYVTKGVRFWLYPTEEQDARLWQFGNAARHAWNWTVKLCDDEYERALAETGFWKPWVVPPRTRSQRHAHDVARRKAYKDAKTAGKKIDRPPINLKRLYEAYCNYRDSDDGCWVRHKQIHSHVYSYPIQNLVKAYNAFWKGLREGRDTGLPHFKPKGTRPSFTIQISRKHLRSFALCIPGIGEVSTRQRGRTKTWIDRQGRVRGGHPLRRSGRDPLVECNRGEACVISVRYVVDHWEVSVTMRDVELAQAERPTRGPVGIDFGRHSFVTLSSETLWQEEPENPLLRRLERLERKRLLHRSGSRGRKRVNRDIASLRVRIEREGEGNARALERHLDVLARLQIQLRRRARGSHRHGRLKEKVSKLHDRIARIRAAFLHKLSRKLVREHDKIATEGFNVKKLVSEEVGFRKHRRRIMDGAWGEFRRQLQYKSEWAGRQFLKHPEFSKTDQACWLCGELNKMPPNTSRYTCSSCGSTTTRQANTARLLERSFLRQPPQENSPEPKAPNEGTPSVGGTHARPRSPSQDGPGVSPRLGDQGARRSGASGGSARIPMGPRRNVE